MELEHRLYRSRRERVIAGICGGISEYFDIDPTIVRLVALVTIFFQGAGLLIYLIAWIVLPEPPEDAEVHLPRRRPPSRPGPGMGPRSARDGSRAGKPRPPIQFPGPKRQQEDVQSDSGDDAPSKPRDNQGDK